MDALIVLVAFVAGWVGFSRWAKTRKLSATVASGGGFIAACLAAIAASLVVVPGAYAPAAERRAPAVPAVPAEKLAPIKAAEFGEGWPLIAGEATLGCIAPSIAFVDVGGRRCALNGKALRAGFERCDDVAKTGNAVALGAFIERALALCPGRE